MTIHKTIIALLLGVFMLSACTPAEVQPTQPLGEQTGLLDQEWVLESIGQKGSATAAIDGVAVTLTLDSDGNAGGSAGCNHYGGVYIIKGDQISFGEIVSTLMACVDDAVMEQEMQYLQALSLAGTYLVSNDRLTIEYNDGGSVLTFIKGSAATP